MFCLNPVDVLMFGLYTLFYQSRISKLQSQLLLEKMEYPIFYIHVEPYIVGKLGYILQLLPRYYCNLSCTEGLIFFIIYSTVYLASPNKKFYRIQTQKIDRCRTSRTHTAHNTTHKNKMSRCLPTPSGFALYLHGNICHGPKSWCRGSPRVCCRRLAVGSLSLRLVPLVGTPNEDASKNREGD